jgi:hypothetical protein
MRLLKILLKTTEKYDRKANLSSEQTQEFSY